MITNFVTSMRLAVSGTVTAMAFTLVAGALVLVLSGAVKLNDPTPTSRALRAARLPSSLMAVRALGVLEIAAASAALTTRARPGAVPVAVLYIGFTGFVFYALAKRLPIASCGCFGKADTPPSALHAVFNSLVAGQALIAIIDDAERPTSTIAWIVGTAWAACFVVAITRTGKRSAR